MTRSGRQGAESTSSGDDPERAAIGPGAIARAESTSSGDDPERAAIGPEQWPGRRVRAPEMTRSGR